MLRDTGVGLARVAQPIGQWHARDAAHGAAGDWLVIVNPSAGHHTNRSLHAISRRLQRELTVDVAITRSYGQIAELLGSIAPAGGVAVYGGDGTIAEVVNNMQLERQRLLVLPGGTGNGLARDLGIVSVDRALAAYRADTYRPIDLIEVTFTTPRKHIRRLMVSTLSLGYAAEAVALARRLPPVLNSLRYTLASIMQATWMPSCTLWIDIEAMPPRQLQLTNLMINNTRHAGNFRVFRDASLWDGQSNILLAENTFWQQVLHNLSLLSHTYLYQPGWELQARSLHLRSPKPLRLMLDGEIWEDVYEMQVGVLSQQLRCYYAPARNLP